MTLTLEVFEDADTAARHVAALAAERVRGGLALALSKAPETMLHGLADLPWADVRVYQVDERVAPAGHPDRNLTALLAALPSGSVNPMPVDEPDLERAADRYASELPQPLDFVHLGLGPDGHTASLVPGDPVLEVRDRLVAVTGEHQGYRRMTLTYPVLDAAREIVWLVTGAAKREALSRLFERDPAIPAARITNPNQLVVADAAALGPRTRG